MVSISLTEREKTLFASFIKRQTLALLIECLRATRVTVTGKTQCGHFSGIGDLGDPFWKP
jgi:hypothetical protein